MLAGVLAASCAASAQTLNLGPATEPVVATDNAEARLRARLADEIGGHKEHLQSAIDAGDRDWVLASSLSIATRALALRMLEADPVLAGARSIRLLDARTIADLAPSIDALGRASVDLAFQSRGLEGERGIELAARGEAARASIDAFLRAATPDPSDPASVRGLPPTAPDLDRFLLQVFDELRPLIGAVEGDAPDIEPAWPVDPAGIPPQDAIDAARTALDGAPGFDASDRDGVAGALNTLDAAARLPMYRRSARAMAQQIGDAISAAAMLASTPWLGERRGEFARVVAGAAAGLTDRATRDASIRTLGRVTRLAGMVANVGVLESRRVNGLAAQHAVAGVAMGMLDADPSPDGAPGVRADILGAIERTLAIGAGRPVVEPDYFANPGVRRAWRLMERDYEETERRALSALEEMVGEPRRLTSPDVISLLKKQRDSAEDLRRMAKIPAWETQLRSKPSTPAGADGSQGDAPGDALVDNLVIEQSVRTGAADRLAALLLAMARDEVRAQALEALEAFEDNWSRYATLPGEALLGGETPATVEVTGGRAAQALAAMRRDRQDWLAAWAQWKLEDTEPPLDRLDAEARIGRAIEVCVALSDPDRLDALNRWAPVELTREGVGVVRRQAKETVSALVSAMIGGDWTKADELLVRWEATGATARLLARLAEATAWTDWPSEEGAASLVAQLGSGVPTDAWARGQRAELADLSRWIAELGVADERGDADLRRAIMAHLEGLSRGSGESLAPQ